MESGQFNYLAVVLQLLFMKSFYKKTLEINDFEHSFNQVDMCFSKRYHHLSPAYKLTLHISPPFAEQGGSVLSGRASC